MLEVMRLKQNGTPASAATVTMTIDVVKAFMGFAHQVGYTRFNAAPLIKLKKAPRMLAQRIMAEFDTQSILRAAKPGRERILCEVGYYGALRVSEIASLTWSQVIPRESGEAQLALVGKGDKPRHVLLPAETAKLLIALLGEVAPSARLFPIMERRINYILKAIAKRAKRNPNISPHWLRHTHASHAIDNGAPITLVSHPLGHADLKTTSVYAHARPIESSSRLFETVVCNVLNEQKFRAPLLVVERIGRLLRRFRDRCSGRRRPRRLLDRLRRRSHPRNRTLWPCAVRKSSVAEAATRA
jgi:site-specific recombinase XerD